MGEYSFEWKLYFNTYFPEWIVSGSLHHKINEEWRLSMSSGILYPLCVEVHRNSTVGQTAILGTFNLMSGKLNVFQKDFIKWFRDGDSSTRIWLEYDCRNKDTQSYSINGNLTVHSNWNSLLELSADIQRLLGQDLFADAILKCGSDSFPVHKCILFARSPVFATMFTTQMKESRNNNVEINDIQPHMLKMILTYIYTGNIGTICRQNAGELLFAADKYQLLGLKRICIDFLKSCMTVENVLDILVLGYLHNKELKAFALYFIAKNHGEFTVLEQMTEWKNLSDNMPALANQVLSRLNEMKFLDLDEK